MLDGNAVGAAKVSRLSEQAGRLMSGPFGAVVDSVRRLVAGDAGFATSRRGAHRAVW